jgi:hypothetical protein
MTAPNPGAGLPLSHVDVFACFARGESLDSPAIDAKNAGRRGFVLPRVLKHPLDVAALQLLDGRPVTVDRGHLAGLGARFERREVAGQDHPG